MRPFPENFELESFFECEPEVLDKNVPWAYNRLKFLVEASNGVLLVEMEPGYETMYVVWRQGENTVLELKLIGVMSLQITDEKRYDTLIAKFRNNDTEDLVLKIRPYIKLTWGYNDHPLALHNR
jgi:hypothetical protein